MCSYLRRKIQDVVGESGCVSLSRDGVTEIGMIPTIVAIVSDTAEAVTDSSDCCRFSLVVPNLRGTFDIRYYFYGDALSVVLPICTLAAESFLARISEFSIAEQNAKPVFVGRKLVRSWPSDPSLGLRRVWRAWPNNVWS